jgi:hypothetical protein
MEHNYVNQLKQPSKHYLRTIMWIIHELSQKRATKSVILFLSGGQECSGVLEYLLAECATTGIEFTGRVITIGALLLIAVMFVMKSLFRPKVYLA